MSKPTYLELRSAIINYDTSYSLLRQPCPVHSNTTVSTHAKCTCKNGVVECIEAHSTILKLAKKLRETPDDGRTNY